MVVIVLEVAVATIRRSTAEEEGTPLPYLALPRLVLPPHPPEAQDPLLQILAHPLQ